MKKIAMSSTISIVLDIIIYLFFILSGFEADMPYYIFLGLNVVSFLYHYFLISSEKMELLTFIVHQFLLLTISTITWYVLVFLGINLQQYHWTIAIIAIVLIVVLIDYFINKFRKSRAAKIEDKTK